jgi:hypothetical protein
VDEVETSWSLGILGTTGNNKGHKEEGPQDIPRPKIQTSEKTIVLKELNCFQKHSKATKERIPLSHHSHHVHLLIVSAVTTPVIRVIMVIIIWSAHQLWGRTRHTAALVARNSCCNQ